MRFVTSRSQGSFVDRLRVAAATAGIAAVLFGYIATVAFAQGPTSLKGVVRVSGKTDPVPNALVRLQRNGSTMKIECKTDKHGNFGRAGLLPGVYHLTVECDGFQPFEMSAVEVRNNENLSLVLPISKSH